MLIPIIKKNAALSGFECRDGEIEWEVVGPLASRRGAAAASTQYELSAAATYPAFNIRIPLESGDADKVAALLGGEISRVDAASAERITQAILTKGAEALLQTATDLRRQGLFLLPFRFCTSMQTPYGKLTFPSPQALALVADFPPHPEITAYGVADNTLTLALRLPVKPHRLVVEAVEGLPEGFNLRTFISYPLYIPDPKEIRGSIGSVRSAAGGNATGLRFAFLSSSALKASVAAPEKYYEMVGNERTGYRISSKAATPPDYSCYADSDGSLPPFPSGSLLATGEGVDDDTDPGDWIADWEEVEEGWLPRYLPVRYDTDAERDDTPDIPSDPDSVAWPDGIDKETVLEAVSGLGLPYMLLTRPMAFAGNAVSRRNASPVGISALRIHGLPDTPCLAVWYASSDGVHWEGMRVFDPHEETLLMIPPRLWHRLLLMSAERPRNPVMYVSLQE